MVVEGAAARLRLVAARFVRMARVVGSAARLPGAAARSARALARSRRTCLEAPVVPSGPVAVARVRDTTAMAVQDTRRMAAPGGRYR